MIREGKAQTLPIMQDGHRAQKTHIVMISEIFGPTIQGEGALIGVPTIFVRTGGCDYRCIWCDTLYAVLPEYKAEWTPMTAEQIMTEVQRLSGNKPILVTLSGGNPAIQPLEDLLALGRECGYTFALETQGSVAQPWFAQLDYLTLSPKPPSSKQRSRWERLDRCIALAQKEVSEPRSHRVQIDLKIVVFDEQDFAYAREVARRYPDRQIYLQTGNHTPPQSGERLDTTGILQRMDWLIQRVIEEHWYSAKVLPQLHVLLWGNKRGV